MPCRSAAIMGLTRRGSSLIGCPPRQMTYPGAPVTRVRPRRDTGDPSLERLFRKGLSRAIVRSMDRAQRKLRDAEELRVLAHPVRMRLRQALYARGSATATELAEMIGESPANCSWHLRQLAKYGFVEEAGGGTGRNRPWRAVSHTLFWGDSGETGEVAAAGDHLSSMIYEQEFAALRDWHAWWRTDPPEWQDAANFAQCLTWLTAEELAEFNRE